MTVMTNIFTRAHQKTIEPGGLYFGEDEDIIYTLLGSCVAVTLWHPVKKIAAMCHAILPAVEENEYHHRYADCAIDKLISEIKKYNTIASDYEVGVFGGGNMFPDIFKNNNASHSIVGDRNVEEVVGLLIRNNFHIKFKDVGGKVARRLTLIRETGEIDLEYVTAN